MTQLLLSDLKACPQRIMIFGRPGSGKSTFAVELALKLNLPLYHLDKYFVTAQVPKI